MLAISDSQGTLIWSYVVDFSAELKESFGKVLMELKNLALDWAYPDNLSAQNDTLLIPDIVAQAPEDIPTIKGLKALQGTANL